MEDHVKELLVTMDLSSAHMSPNIWACLIGFVLIFRAISVGSHEISIEEFITLFQPKDNGGKAKGVMSCASRLGASKLVLGLPDVIHKWKERFFYVYSTDWEHDSRYPNIHDLKRSSLSSI